MDFRELVKKGLLLRVADFFGHVLFGWILGSIFVQFIPDMFLPIIWIRSWKKNALLPEDDFCLVMHKTLHTVWPAYILFCAYVVFGSEWILWSSIQVFVHVLWDTQTHPEPEFQKSIWRFGVG